MTCKDCIHSGLCYKENDYKNFPDRCGSFISDKALKERLTEHWISKSDAIYGFPTYLCSNCQYEGSLMWKYCPNCGAKMEEEEAEDDGIIRSRPILERPTDI